MKVWLKFSCSGNLHIMANGLLDPLTLGPLSSFTYMHQIWPVCVSDLDLQKRLYDLKPTGNRPFLMF